MAIRKELRGDGIGSAPAGTDGQEQKKEPNPPIFYTIIFGMAAHMVAFMALAFIWRKTPEGLRVYWAYELMPWMIPLSVALAVLALFFLIIHFAERRLGETVAGR